jgi:hypothetical protein
MIFAGLDFRTKCEDRWQVALDGYLLSLPSGDVQVLWLLTNPDTGSVCSEGAGLKAVKPRCEPTWQLQIG